MAGGNRHALGGTFFEPTVLANVHVHDDAETAVRTARTLAEHGRLIDSMLTMGRRADFARAAARAAVPEVRLCRGHLL